MESEDFYKQYQTEEWRAISNRIKSRDHHTCQMCGRNDKPLHVHHFHYGKRGSIFGVDDSEMITLCEDCHKKQHDFKYCIDGLINEMRNTLTDLEIVEILCKDLRDYCGIKYKGDGYPSPINKSNIDEFSSINKDALLRLSKWREPIYRKILVEKKEAYYLSLTNNNQ